jgi:vacuolar protein sorting-associated protein 16
MTMGQFQAITPEVLIVRLIARNHHFLALRICDLLKLKNERVLVHWACEKVRRMGGSKLSDEDINILIRKQLDPYGKVSYLPIAEAAYIIGRRRLATLILDREQHPGDQIPLLLRMNEEELALQKAVNSEDTDLIYYTLISLESRIVLDRGNSIDSFYRIIHTHPEAANLLKIYHRNKVTPEDRNKLTQLLMYSKNYFEAGIAAVNQAYQQKQPNQKMTYLHQASAYFGQGKDLGFFKTMTDEEIELLDLQRMLETHSQHTKQGILGLGMVQTLEFLVFLGLDVPAEQRWAEQEVSKIVKRFKISEKSLWYVKIRCYSDRGDWTALQRLAQEKKSPVGYKPFARACME